MNYITNFLTCGSVDDGKSTMIGKLLFDAGLIFEDHLDSLKKDQEKLGNLNSEIDYSLLLDGLISEREQGITIDVAYRYFTLNDKKYIVADTPGHTQYTKNMATGASHCSSAIILIDARKGLGMQTRRHTLICALMGIKRVMFAINKFDLIDWSEDVYIKIKNDCKLLIEDLNKIELQFDDYICTPISALQGDNLFVKSKNMPWYNKQIISEWLNELNEQNVMNESSFKFVVQSVIKSNLNNDNYQPEVSSTFTNNELKNLRAYSGKIISGNIATGQRIKIASSEITTGVKGIIQGFNFVNSAMNEDSISLMLEDEIDISKGEIITSESYNLKKSKEFIADIIWMDKESLQNKKRYILKNCSGYQNINIKNIEYKYNLETFEKTKTNKLELNEVGLVKIHTQLELPFEKYQNDKTLGAFIIIDKISNLTVGCGMIREITSIEQINNAANKPMILWFTGLSGSGKTTVSERLKKEMTEIGIDSVLLDGDEIRKGICRDLGFDESSRSENIRRTAEIAKLVLGSGVNVLCSLISPFAKDRQLAREILSDYQFVEVFVDAPIEVCEQRDVKGYYKKARSGEIKHFTGISSPYEKPDSPEIILKTGELSIDETVKLILNYLGK